MTAFFEQTFYFDAPAHTLYEMLMDSEVHAEFTNSRAEISREVGGNFVAYDGYITGTNLELVPDQKIVQRWRAVDWPEDYYSVVTFTFIAQNGGTRLDLTHTGLPDGTEEEFKQGWIENYWEPMKAFLEG